MEFLWRYITFEIICHLDLVVPLLKYGLKHYKIQGQARERVWENVKLGPMGKDHKFSTTFGIGSNRFGLFCVHKY